jgi:hypothetical protein
MRSTVPFLFLGAVALAAAAGLAPACATSGHIGGGGETSGDEGGDGSSTTVVSSADGGCEAAAPPAPPVLGVSVFNDTCQAGASPTVDFSPLRRVSRLEYNNMVQDLLGNTSQPAQGFNAEVDLGAGVNLQSNTYAGLGGDDLIAEQYLQTAESVAAEAVLHAPAGDGGAAFDNLTTVYNLNGLTLCATEDDACAQQFIATFANRAFRGHFDSNEAAILFTVYSQIADVQNFGFRIGIQAVITAVLSSPYFLYVVELGDGTTQTGTAMPLSQYEIAARLAFFLWRSVPDIGPGSLMEAAAAGTLSTPAQIQAQVLRMMTGTFQPKAVVALTDFATQWLELEAAPSGKDQLFGKWQAYTGQEMKDETITNVLQLILSENGGLTELLTSPSSYVNSDLAQFYGGSIGSGTSVTVADPLLSQGQQTFVQTTLPNRAGILTNGSILAIQAHSLLPSVVLRGKLVREDILCDPIGNPPPGVKPLATAVPDGGTTRQVFEAHATGGCFTACHQYMDEIGYSLGHYDATGAYQTLDENGLSTGPALDVTGQIYPKQTGELNAALNGVTGTTGLTSTLASAPQVQECFALQEFRYSLGRLETADDSCSIQQFYSAFTGSSLNIQKLILAIVASDAFLYRSVIGASCQVAVDAGSCP